MDKEDRRLVSRAAAGDQAAFGALYDRHAGRVYHLLRRLSGNDAEAEDLTQETFLAAYRSLSVWRGEGALGTWLCGIAVRLQANAYRQRAARETECLTDDLEVPDPLADPLQHCTQEEAERRIHGAIGELPHPYRAVFLLVKVEGLSYREAAECLEVPLGTIQSRLSRAVGLLQVALRDLTEQKRVEAAKPEPSPSGRGGPTVQKVSDQR
jgi:RNA polymerase sigma-70 factor (ECF subfamily)